MPLILPGNVASATASTGYDVANSCRFNTGDSPYLSKTFGASGNQKTFTLSTWIKRSTLGISYPMLYGGAAADAVYFTAEDQLLVICGSGSDDRRISTMVFRDTSAWYHIVQKFDTTQGTAADRYTLYVNGTEAATSVVGGKNEITQDLDIALFYNAASYISFDGSSDYFDGYMAETVHIDGSALAASSFGEFDSDSPTIWKPKDVSGLTFGTNGFYLSYSDSADLGADSSGNSNDFTSSGLDATDQATDTPTNNFCTLNPLWVSSNTYSEGNTEVAGGGAHRPNIPTMAVSSGKWYMEGKLIAGNTNKWFIGYADQEFYDAQQNQTGNLNWGGGNTAGGTNQINVSVNNGWSNQLNLYPNSAVTSFFSSSSVADDIIGLAVDLDDQKAWWSQNGVWRNGSAAESTTFNASYPDTTQLDAGRNYYIGTGSEDSTWSVNYGNPSFAISSGNADANGYGNMEYAIPDGYYCLCTKNLAEFG